MISIEELEAIYCKLDLLNLNKIKPHSIHDRVMATQNIMNDEEWHNNMIKNVASYVSKGLEDNEILSIASAYTRPGFTHEDTQKEVQKAIDGAKVKGFHKPRDSFAFTKNNEKLLKQISHGPIEPTNYLIEGLFEEHTISLLFGAPASGKSFIAMSIACSVASGFPFFGNSVKKGSVIYIAGEGRRGLRKRAYAWSQWNNMNWGSLSVLISERSVGILDTEDFYILKEEIDANIPKHGNPALIIVDTLNRNFGGGDENSNADMGHFIKALEFLQKNYDCNILIVHHSGHGEKARIRGASALTAAVDNEYSVHMKQERIVFTCTKMKDDEPPDTMHFQLIPLPNEQAGELIGEPLAVLTESTSRVIDGVPNRYALAVRALKEAEKKGGQQVKEENCLVTDESWREEFFKISSSTTEEGKRRAFKRAQNGLINDGFVVKENDFYRRVNK